MARAISSRRATTGNSSRYVGCGRLRSRCSISGFTIIAWLEIYSGKNKKGRRDRPSDKARQRLHLDLGIEAVYAGDAGLGQYMAFDRSQYIRAPECTADAAFRHIERINCKHIMMNDSVIPRQAWTVIAEIIARHVLVGSKPHRIVVDALTCAARTVGPWLAARADAI